MVVPKRRRMIALDTECTGLDLRHGARPFFVSVADEEGNNTYWEWDVDPETRMPKVPKADLLEIREIIDDADAIVMQNAKFDVLALHQVGIDGEWPWCKTYDTLLAGHLLASNQPHDLTTMAVVYLGVNLDPYESALKAAVVAARREAAAEYPTWRLAKVGLHEMPSAKGKAWKYDCWLPRTMARAKGYLCTHPWHNVCREYGNSDSTATLALFQRQQVLLEQRSLWCIYQERLKVLPVVYAMEDCGVTVSRCRLKELREQYRTESQKAGRVCLQVAKGYGYDLELPKSGNNKSLTTFVFDHLKMPAVKTSRKTGAASLDKSVLEQYEATVPSKSKAAIFLQALRGKRKRDTALNYMEGYEKFWLPLRRTWFGKKLHTEPDWFILHPSLNPTGTDTLRWSSSNPNEQNISKQEGFNLRYCFGPAEGREWWSLDYENIELRIPAYEAGEGDLVHVFEHPLDPPYYGSYHLVIADLLHPALFKEHGKEFKRVFESTWYQWLKNGNFAVIYGAQEATADRTYHVQGAYAKIQRRFPRIAALGKRQIALAQKQGYIETMPDKTVDPDRGYPLLCSRSNWGSVSPTVPLNYHVQGTAMWIMMKSMIRCQQYLQHHTGHYMVMQVHDELVFDFPRGHTKTARDNHGHISRIKRLMEQGGSDVGVPTPVSITYHAETWSDGVSL